MKYRPAVVVSSSRFNRIQQDLIAAAITSNPYTEQGAYSYTLKKEECKRAGLFSPSAVKLGKIVTIDQRLVRKRIGILSSRSIIHIIAEVHKIIDKSGR